MFQKFYVQTKEKIRPMFLRTRLGIRMWDCMGRLKRAVKPSHPAVPPEMLPSEPPAVRFHKKPFGVNLIGYITSEHGVGEACRHVADALEASGMPWTAYDWEISNVSRKADMRWRDRCGDGFPYGVSLFHVNADQMPVVRQLLGADAWSGYRIGIWYWELEDFPDEWLGSFKLVDEIWAPTRFIADSLSMKAPCPVIYMPPPLTLDDPGECSRDRFGLPDDRFLFLTMYDTQSVQSRKNPMAVIEAFKAAFRRNEPGVGLVVKINNARMTADEVERLEEIRREHENIYLLKETMDRVDVNRLLKVCDVTCSLHRSEGLGLVCQEAMFLGKPVIATNWSGNVDFMGNDCACMVDYRLIPLGRDLGYYKAYQRWAEADTECAARYMKRLFENAEWRNRIAANAKKMIRENYSPEICGGRMRKRLEFLNSHIDSMEA